MVDALVEHLIANATGQETAALLDGDGLEAGVAMISRMSLAASGSSMTR
jgi:hypothetical protein